MIKDLSNYILMKLRRDGEVNLKLKLINRTYNTVHGKITVEEIDLIVGNLIIKDFGIESFEGIDIDEN